MYVHHTYYIHKYTFIHLLENIWVIYQSNSNILQQVKGEGVVLSHNGYLFSSDSDWNATIYIATGESQQNNVE